MRFLVPTLLAAFTALAAQPARAGWAPNGNPVVTAAGDQYSIVTAPFGSGGALVVWEDARRGDFSEIDIYAQAMTADGARAPGWPVDGVPVCAVSGLQRYASVITDAGGAYITWFDWRATMPAAYLQRIAMDGSVATGWPSGGLRIGEDAWYSTRPMATDGAGGLYIVRADPSGVPVVTRIQRFTAAGAPAPGWPLEGISLGTFHGPAPALSPDGSGGVFIASVVSTSDQGAARVNVQRLTSDGSVHPSWPPTGVMVGNDALIHNGLMIFPDQSGGIFVTWQDAAGVCVEPAGRLQAPGDTEPSILPCGAQNVVRLDANGSVLPEWLPVGRRIGPSGTVEPDGLGGLLYTWTQGDYFLLTWVPGSASSPPSLGPRSDVKVMRLDGSGERPPGWLTYGNPICTEEGFQGSAKVVADDAGGALVSWTDWRTYVPVLYVTRLDASGHIAGGWPVTGSIAAPLAHGPSEVALVDAGQSRAIVVWVDDQYGSRDVFADIVVPGPPGPPAPLAGVFDGSARFGIVELRPNPTRGAFWAIIGLPESGRATLELFDIAGRIVEETSVDPGSPARGAVRLNASRTMAPGVYWLRLRQAGRKATARIVVSD